MLNFHQSLPFLNWLFLLLHFPQEFPATFSRKNFSQDFPATISQKIFPQQFPARFSCKIFLSWILIGWLPITLFQMLNFHQSLSFFNWTFPLLHFPQEFPARICHKIFPQQFPPTISHNNFPQDFPTPISHVFSSNNFPLDFPALDTDWLAPHHPIPNDKFPPITVFLELAFPPPFPTRISHKNLPQDFPTTISHNIFPQQFTAPISRKIFPQDFPARFS